MGKVVYGGLVFCGGARDGILDFLVAHAISCLHFRSHYFLSLPTHIWYIVHHPGWLRTLAYIAGVSASEAAHHFS